MENLVVMGEESVEPNKHPHFVMAFDWNRGKRSCNKTNYQEVCYLITKKSYEMYYMVKWLIHIML